MGAALARAVRGAGEEFGIGRRGAADRDRVLELAVIGPEHAERRLAQPQRAIEQRREDRRQVAARGRDHLQHLGRRRLLRQRLIALAAGGVELAAQLRVGSLQRSRRARDVVGCRPLHLPRSLELPRTYGREYPAGARPASSAPETLQLRR